MKPDLPSGTVTFLFTDVEGSTKLLKGLGSRYAEVLSKHHELVRSACATHGGREVDTQGDAFFLVFPRGKDAMAAAVAVQRALAAHPWPDGLSIKVRMGLHTDEPTVDAERYVGMGVHKAARIMADGHGGQVLLSSTTRDLVEDDLPPGVTLSDLGERQLKDIERPERIFQLEITGLPSVCPPLRTLDVELTRKRRRRVYLWSAVLAVAAAGVAIPAVLLGRGAGTRAVAPNSVAVIDTRTDKVVGQLPVGIRPDAITAGKDSVWVANRDDQTLTRIDAQKRTVVRTIALNATPTGVAEGYGSVWIAEGPTGALARADPAYDRVTETLRNLTGPVRVSGTPTGSVAVGGGAVWAAYGNATVVRVDPGSSRVINTDFAGFSASAIAYGAGAVWVANQAKNTVSRLSPLTNRKILEINVGRAPSGVAAGGGAVWVTDRGDDSISRVDPTSSASTTIPVGREPVGIAYGAGAVWVANSKDGTVAHRPDDEPGDCHSQGRW